MGSGALWGPYGAALWGQGVWGVPMGQRYEVGGPMASLWGRAMGSGALWGPYGAELWGCGPYGAGLWGWGPYGVPMGQGYGVGGPMGSL